MIPETPEEERIRFTVYDHPAWFSYSFYATARIKKVYQLVRRGIDGEMSMAKKLLSKLILKHMILSTPRRPEEYMVNIISAENPDMNINEIREHVHNCGEYE